MRYRRILFYRGTIYFIAVLLAVGSVIYSGRVTVIKELEMTTLDAVIIYAMIGLKRLPLPFLIAYVNMHRFKYDFKYQYLVRGKGRLRLWYCHIINVAVDCVVVTALMMLTGAVTGYIICDENVDFYSSVSVCMDEFMEYGMAVPYNMNIPAMIIEMFVISSGELVARTLFAWLIYWMANSKSISLLGVIILSNFSIGDMGVRGIVWFGNLGGSMTRIKYYSALYFPAQVMEILLLLALIIMLVLLTAQIFVPAKEFIKKQNS